MEAKRTLLVLNTGFTIGIDGPGQRLVVYLKGCNMCCPWCGAPESMDPRPQALFYPARLENPARARPACPWGAVSVDDGITRDVTICGSCSNLECIATDNPAFDLAGREMSVEALVDMATRYRGFFARSGGVTVGGGEPTSQWDGLEELLARLKEVEIHTALETNGTNDRLPELFGVIDVLLIDLKHPDSGRCSQVTGQGNEVVLTNIRARYEHGGDMVVRICLVPGFNADERTLRGFGSVLSPIGHLNVEVIPMHRRGEAKWRALGAKLAERALPSQEEIELAYSILSEYGLAVTIA